jgi:uncharacterized protein (TIGR04222 family)
MFPFDLPGPEFLLFYAAFFVVVLVLLYLYRQDKESDPPPPVAPNDPYLMACLRGGPKEVICAATVGLIDRGFLTIAERKVGQSPSANAELLSHPIEKEIWAFFEDPADLFAVNIRPAVLEVAAEYEAELRRLKLIPDEQIQGTRRTAAWFAAGLLLAVGALKLTVALSSGHTNVAFLIVMMVVAPYVVMKTGFPYRTATGNKYLANMRALFSGLHDQVKSIQPGTGTREVLWALSIFGVSALPASAFPAVQYFTQARGGMGGGGDGGGGGCGGGGGGGGGGCGGCGGGGGG